MSKEPSMDQYTFRTKHDTMDNYVEFFENDSLEELSKEIENFWNDNKEEL